MRSYKIDELSAENTQLIIDYMKNMNLDSSIEGVFWFPIPQDLLTPLQKEHNTHCGPYSMALAIEEKAVQLEMLVRARGCIHCHCVSYATPELRNHMIDYIDDLLEKLSIAV